ncbi:D-inositol-3-phosphate glycosyltransferase [bioreactor metagenome]|uniref:D-inositol-3-phosphate glycosyltransferase n=1 Tax=bioreactor metagenome TaxID=1076179 RepID=A0A644UIB9_9ZZZZ|nr:glycosyltransferase family 1 protein [Lentimicrobium sp.]MEA5109664.1 glycosyltransferase family 1 protein [Lentimicrobium sp.]
MKIAVNTRLLLHGKLEGIGWFSYENLKRITTGHPEHQFYFLFDRPYHRDFIFSDNVIPLVAGPPARHPVLYYIWFEFTVRRLLKKIGADLFLSPDGYLSLGSKIPSIAVFHDLNFEHYPGDLPLAERWYYRTFFRKYAAKAARIATVSGFSKADITKQYGTDPEKIDVVYNGANEEYLPVDESVKSETRKKYTGGRPYFFFVGSMHPRKNLVNLFRAFDLYRKTDNRNTVLLLAGAKKWWTGEIASVYENMEFKDDVIFSGRLETSEMRDVMGSAIALTYVSYFEGFGIPIVEAFRCGTPVITSNITSMPEVGGEAALYADPFKPGEIADAMIKIANDDTLREHLIKAGAERAGIFTWDQSALRLWQTIEKVLATQTDFSARL